MQYCTSYETLRSSTKIISLYTQSYAQQDYVWNNKAVCDVMINIPEDSCSASGAHATTHRRVHKCEVTA